MRRPSWTILFALVLTACWNVPLAAQDLHFSQYDWVPSQLNPALTASDVNWDTRMGILYRDQWRSVPVTYQTSQLFYDQKLTLPVLSKGQWGFGGSLLHDQAGDGQLSWTQAGLRIAYHHPINREHRLSGGIGADFGQRAVRAEQLAFGDQYNGEIYDPSQFSAEQLDRPAAGFASLHGGLSYQWIDRYEEKKLVAGWSAYHLNQPLISFRDDSGVPLSVRHAVFVQGQNHFVDQWEALGYGHYIFQGSYFETLVRAGMRYHTSYQDEALVLGASIAYRIGDAWIPQLTVQYQQWALGLAYDINTSPFQTATNGRGGAELILQYYLKQAKPPDEFKSCPVF